VTWGKIRKAVIRFTRSHFSAKIFSEPEHIYFRATRQLSMELQIVQAKFELLSNMYAKSGFFDTSQQRVDVVYTKSRFIKHNG